MIKNIKQASDVQDRRASSGKRGYAKAVRRFLQSNFDDEYLFQRNKLSVKW